jgi:hypothetical protein
LDSISAPPRPVGCRRFVRRIGAHSERDHRDKRMDGPSRNRSGGSPELSDQ